MADPSEILNVIAAQVAAIVYPNGTSSASISGTALNVYAGWPVHSVLNTDILAGTSHISVFPLDGEQKIPTALGRPYREVESGDPTIVATVSDSSVTLSGTVSTPQNVYLLVDGTGYHYAVQSDDTLTTIATAMSTLIPAASNVDAVISIPQAIEIIARVGGVGSQARELRRQTKEFMVTVWAPTTALRDSLGSALDSGLSINSNLQLSDNLPAFMIYSRSMFSRDTQIYRRDIVFSVNYATSQTLSAPQVVAPVISINDYTQPH
ncbi:hypothetical protein [Rouxiella sp. WC2420]|uniref:Baseplate protein J-like domain-containing protein n=1 Tax=Rouxiella sp. WC2420 TaxID=3234145 RepID=A0AB39VLI5_9GAMM